MGEYFSPRASTGSREDLTPEAGEGAEVEGQGGEDNNVGGENGEDEGGESEDQTDDEHDETVEAPAPEVSPQKLVPNHGDSPQTPVKQSSPNDDDPMNELLAWKMGGDTMLKPTPSPYWVQSADKRSSDGGDPDPEACEAIDAELARVEYLASSLSTKKLSFGILMIVANAGHLRQEMEQRRLAFLAKRAKSTWNLDGGSPGVDACETSIMDQWFYI